MKWRSRCSRMAWTNDFHLARLVHLRCTRLHCQTRKWKSVYVLPSWFSAISLRMTQVILVSISSVALRRDHRELLSSLSQNQKFVCCTESSSLFYVCYLCDSCVVGRGEFLSVRLADTRYMSSDVVLSTCQREFHPERTESQCIRIHLHVQGSHWFSWTISCSHVSSSLLP